MDIMRKWLKDIRRQRSMTQQQVADKAFIERSYYTHIESGKRNPEPETAIKIAKVLRFHASVFFMTEKSLDPLAITLDNSPTMIAHCDLELRYTWIFNPHEDFRGKEIIGKRDDEIADNFGMKNLMNLKEEVIKQSTVVRKDISFPLSEGIIFYVVFGQPLFNEKRELIGAATSSTILNKKEWKPFGKDDILVENLSNDNLVETFRDAIRNNLDEHFIELLEVELKKRLNKND